MFLVLLEYVTRYRQAHLSIVYALPLAGLLLGLAFERWGGSIVGGSNLVIDSVREDSHKIPLRMAPMVLAGTVITHLFGGSAGREGAAVQMGAAIADDISHRLHLDGSTRMQLLAAGIAGGFGSVFGTPVGGAIFGLEVLAIGRIEYTAMLPALIAAVVGRWVVHALGVKHAAFPSIQALELTPLVFLQLTVLAVAVALMSRLFVYATYKVKSVSTARVPSLPLRMAIGGALVVAMWRLSGTSDFLGLGTETIAKVVGGGMVPAYFPLIKLVFTAVTLGFGFIGGEVVPLFFIGSTLGAVLGAAIGLPVPLSAAIGMAAMFGAASNTPIALTVVAVELFGAAVLPHVAVVCVLAYLMTGHRGIYSAQRIVIGKDGRQQTEAVRLADIRSKR